MTDAQSLSDQPNSRPSSLSESTSDASSDQPSVSSTSTCPPPAPHQIDSWNRHIKFQDFTAGLRDAAKALFPNEKTSRYSCVSVLVLSWQDEDPRLPVSLEIAEVVRVFRDVYNYNVEEWKIPSLGSHLALNRRIMAFVDPAPNDREHLKIVYYAGHGRLTKTRLLEWTSLQDRSRSHAQSRNKPVQWSGIQVLLEQAESDVLILLDCCAAGTANAGGGSGVTELIAACPYNGIANGVGPYSFTNALVTELLELSRKPSFSVGELYSNILIRAQCHIPDLGRDRPAPMHIQLTQQSHFPRSIQVSVRSRMETENNLALPEQQLGAPESDLNESSADSSRNEPDTIVKSSALLPTLVPKPVMESFVPRLLFAVRLEESFQPNELSTEMMTEWLRMIPLIGIQEVKIEAGFNSFSSVVIISVPIAMNAYIPTNPAVFCLGPITSRNKFAELKQQTPVSAKTLTKGTIPSNALAIHRRDSLNSTLANIRKKRTRVLTSSWAKLRLGRLPSRGARTVSLAAPQAGSRHEVMGPKLKRVMDGGRNHSSPTVPRIRNSSLEYDGIGSVHNAEGMAPAAASHRSAILSADRAMTSVSPDPSNGGIDLGLLTSDSLRRLAQNQAGRDTRLEQLRVHLESNNQSTHTTGLLDIQDIEAQSDPPKRAMLGFGSSKWSNSSRLTKIVDSDVGSSCTRSSGSINSKLGQILCLPSSTWPRLASQSASPDMKGPISAAQGAFIFAVTGGSVRSTVAEAAWTWYLSFLESRIREAWIPLFRQVLNNVKLPSYFPVESDFEAAMRLLTIVVGALQRREIALTDIVDDLYNLRVVKEVYDDRVVVTRLVFAAIGWITLLYTPSINGSNMLLELFKHDSFLPADGAPIIHAYEEYRDRSLVDLLRNFGAIIPERKGGSNKTFEVARTHAHDRWIDVTNISFSALSKMSKVQIEWVDCMSLHLEFDLHTKTLKLFQFPSICIVMTPSKESGPLNQLFSDALDEWCQPETDYADEYLREVLASYRLIFGMDRGSYTAFNQLEGVRLPGQNGPLDPLLRILCGQRWDSTEVSRIFDQCDIEDPVSQYNSDSFAFLGTRLLKLQDCVQRDKPEDMWQLWSDKRDISRWWTFWAVMMMGGATMLLGIFQMVLQVAQVYYTLRHVLPYHK
ncbi:hypothetical protein ONS95_006286 [Cadophora gregata]|uniref:uncharacterized protein n=1 Tax=Cadophora gregata TaxID=51156 RepID=UPI0026DACF76|nr:uncharacterized protein ONS95_006286 [Cadophora gregata]KAK0102684.1 hypothetical protein ONS95_006286 [Cadophora gregata]